MTSAKATSGFSRAGSPPRGGLGFRLDLARRLFGDDVRRIRRRLALRLLGIELGDQIFQRSRLSGEVGGALVLRAERLLG